MANVPKLLVTANKEAVSSISKPYVMKWYVLTDGNDIKLVLK